MRKLFVVLLSLAVLSAPALAELDEDEQEEKEEYEEEMGEREVEIEQDGDYSIEIKSKMENEIGESETEKEFKIEIESEDQLEIKLESESETETENTEVENSSEMKVKFDSIVEYQDSNNNGAYDEGEEVNSKELTSFQPLSRQTFENDANQTVNQITSTSTDGVFKVDFYAVGDFAKVGTETVTPTSIKYDIFIDGYDYVQNDTELAVTKEIETESETERENENEDKEEEISSNSADGLKTFLSWKKTAQVDGNTVQVNSTELETEEGEKKVALSYGRGDMIVHDPKVGFATSETSSVVDQVISIPQRIFDLFRSFFNWG